MAKSSEPRLDVHQAVTTKIIKAIEEGRAAGTLGDWQMPWHRPGISFAIPRNALTEERYRGSNILSLWIDADERKYQHQVFATYKQWQELGAQVRKGEKGSLIVKYGEWIPKDAREGAAANGDDDTDAAKRLYARPAWVFNIDQVDAPPELRARLLPPATPREDLTERLDHVDAFIRHTGAEFREGGQRAFYRHRSGNGEGDFIQMPPRNLFTGTATSTPTESYESTRLHELGHWAHASHRLNLDIGSSRFGSETYAFFELVAELSAAFNCAHLGITNVPRADHAQYLDHWLTVLKGDSKAIFAAASLATRTVDYLFRLQPTDPAPAPNAPPLEGAPDTGPNEKPQRGSASNARLTRRHRARLPEAKR